MKKSMLTLLLVASFGLQAEGGQWVYSKVFHDYYKILKLKTKNPTPAELKSAYRNASLRAHPDRGGNSAGFAIVKDAYETLGDPTEKKKYDHALNNHLSEGWHDLSDDDWSL